MQEVERQTPVAVDDFLKQLKKKKKKKWLEIEFKVSDFSVFADGCHWVVSLVTTINIDTGFL